MSNFLRNLGILNSTFDIRNLIAISDATVTDVHNITITTLPASNSLTPQQLQNELLHFQQNEAKIYGQTNESFIENTNTLAMFDQDPHNEFLTTDYAGTTEIRSNTTHFMTLGNMINSMAATDLELYGFALENKLEPSPNASGTNTLVGLHL
ncbi:hypothetical protein FRX31_026475 [Thalictrum thalictroides]|uniref:Uncharacterized protein n=1 Tax=Thalictrum thalictroides TaxID=46969 RepID=A0A7J6VH48_THATH|nr:hypothetical protein FRX31_026475 [Thalictrum thalictroides]